MVSATDRLTLQSLASQVRAIADAPGMADRRAMWREHNALRGGKPLVLAFPEGAWTEMLPDSALTCTDPQMRQWERALRMRAMWADCIRDDALIEPCWDVNWQVKASDYGVEIPKVWGDNRGSYVWTPPIQDLEKDFAKLKPRTFSVDRAATQRAIDLASDIFGDVLPVRVRGRFWWSVGLTQQLSYLVGIEQLMMGMMDQPQAVHRLMAFLSDDMAAFMDFVEREGLVNPQNGGDYVGSGGVGATDELPGEGVSTFADVWGFAESQETVGISPGMFHDFVMPYQKPLLERYGLNCYGCCEGLEHRFDVVASQVPRLRRVSVSPKANQAVLAKKMAGRYIFSRKADPVPVCLGFNEDAIRADIRRTLDLAGDQPLEIILKDTHTVQGDAMRFARWVNIVRQEIDQHHAPRQAPRQEVQARE